MDMSDDDNNNIAADVAADHNFMWKQPTISGLISETTSISENLILPAAADHHQQHRFSWQDHNNSRLTLDDVTNTGCCSYPCGSQGLSLSLSSNINTIISFDQAGGAMSETKYQQDHQDGFFGKPASSGYFPQQQFMQDGFLGRINNSDSDHHTFYQQTDFQLKSSKYLVPAQELLDEFCNLGTKQTEVVQKQNKSQKMNPPEDENGRGAECSRKQSFLYSLDLPELQKRKTKLISMLEEVDRRYMQYCDRMKGVVSWFEALLGGGAASAYSSSASKAMSKHFRCLRDGIVDQIKEIKRAMGEKDPVAPGTTKGETPRLRLVDQTLRQQRAFQQMTMMESHPWRPQRGLPERSVSVLRAWLFEHFLHP